ncbi:C2 domain [Phytophthora cactorum]|nr:C2 domain [Phytophthora cactorum]
MELRFRGKKNAEDADTVGFWYSSKAAVRGPEETSRCGQQVAVVDVGGAEWELNHVLENAELQFMNESTGLLVPRDEEMGKFISERDVVRLCSLEELDALLEKFATRDQDVAAEMMHPKATTPISAALSRLKKMSVTNPTLKKLQKTLDEHTSPHTVTKGSEADALDQFPEVDPILRAERSKKSLETLEPTRERYVSVDEAGIVTHQGCAQFTADVLAQHPEITTREAFLSMSKTPVSSLNKPGTFHVTVHRAMELPGTQLIGKQTPYAKLSLLPWKEPMLTKPVENGGRNPVWINTHDNAMQFSHMYNSTITPIPLLEVEVYNYNYLADDQIACTLVDMSPLLRYPNTSPVLKSADPMYMEHLCFKVRHPNSTFRIDVIDFNSDQCIAQLSVSLFQLLQREADKFIRTNPILMNLRDPLRHLSLNNEGNQAAINDSWAALPILDDKDHYKLSRLWSKLQPYVEHKEDLLRVRVDNDSSLLEREEKEFRWTHCGSQLSGLAGQ